MTGIIRINLEQEKIGKPQFFCFLAGIGQPLPTTVRLHNGTHIGYLSSYTLCRQEDALHIMYQWVDPDSPESSQIKVFAGQNFKIL
jgi:hypothetical protein